MAKAINGCNKEYIEELEYHLKKFVINNRNRFALEKEIEIVSRKSDSSTVENLSNILNDEFFEFLPYEIGDVVEHDKFGSGKVYLIKEVERKNVVFVKFNQVGKKMIVDTNDKMKRIKHK